MQNSELNTQPSLRPIRNLRWWIGGLLFASTVINYIMIGYSSDAHTAMATHSFDSIIIVAGLVPFLGMILVLMLVRNTKATQQGIVRPI